MFCTRKDCVLGKPDALFNADAVDQEKNRWPHLLHGMQHAVADVLQSRGGSAVPFASLSAAQRLPGALAQRQVTMEGNTGTEFPELYCHLSDKNCPGLVGTGYLILPSHCLSQPASALAMPVPDPLVVEVLTLICLHPCAG